MTEEPASLILELLRQMRAELGDVRSEMATKTDLESVRSEVADIKSNMHTLRADVAADILTTRNELGEQIVGLRRAVIDYHTSVIGHGVLISDLEARVRRVEQHLNLPLALPDLRGLPAITDRREPGFHNCAEVSAVVEGRVAAGGPNGSMNCPSRLSDTWVSVPYSAGHDRGK